MFKIGNSEFAIIDFQCCNGNNNDIYIKEVAFMTGESVVPNYFLFKPPFDRRELSAEALKQNEYCRKFVHGLDWLDGEFEYTAVGEILSPLNSYKYIFVFGKNKKDFLLKYLKSNIINLEYQTSFKSLKNFFTGCPVHSDIRFKCALNNIFKLFVFIENNYNKIEEFIYNETSF